MKIEKILKEFKSELQKLYGEKLKKIILYGSYARREESTHSDIDLAIILKGKVSAFEEIDRIGRIAYDFDLKYNIILSIHPISEEHYQSLKTPFLMNVKEEGILI